MKVVLAVALALACVACKKASRKEHEPRTASHEQPPVAAAPRPRTTTADALIAEARQRAGDMQIARIEAKYVHADGTFDPTFGELTVTLVGPVPPDPADDPARPIGAPITARRADRPCDHQTWSARGGWDAPARGGDVHCMMLGSVETGPATCSIPAIWQRAIADGAPKAGLALIGLGGLGGDSRRWVFSIEDAPRGISFRNAYTDAAAECPPVVETPP